MKTELVLLDPTSEVSPTERPRRTRPSSLDGLTVGLLDISKRRGDVFLDRLEELLHERGLAVRRYRKPRFSILAPTELKQQIRNECDLVVEALADSGSCTSCSMHDIRDLEDLGLVAVAIASSEFRQAAAAQNRSLGYDPAVVFVPHPIQDRTDEEMRALADNAAESILNALTHPS